MLQYLNYLRHTFSLSYLSDIWFEMQKQVIMSKLTEHILLTAQIQRLHRGDRWVLSVWVTLNISRCRWIQIRFSPCDGSAPLLRWCGATSNNKPFGLNRLLATAMSNCSCIHAFTNNHKSCAKKQTKKQQQKNCSALTHTDVPLSLTLTHTRTQIQLLQPVSQFLSLRFAGGNPKRDKRGQRKSISHLSSISELKSAGARLMLIYFLELREPLTATVYFIPPSWNAMCTCTVFN